MTLALLGRAAGAADPEGLDARYHRAARHTGPKAAGRLQDLAIDGYWVTERVFFFLRDHLDPDSGAIISLPAIADPERGTVEDVLSLQELLSLFAGSELPIRAEDLPSMEFDMPAVDELVVSFASFDYHIDPRRSRILERRPKFHAPALYSPDRRWVAYLEDADVWVQDAVSATDRPLTRDGAKHRAYARHPDTFTGPAAPLGLWSPNSQWFLTHQLDERLVPQDALMQQSPPEGRRPVLHSFRYPLPGDPLPTATYVAIHVASGRDVVCDAFPVEVAVASPFLLKRAWFSGDDTVWIVRFDRHYRRVELIQWDLLTGRSRVVVEEATSAGYLDLHPMIIGTPNVRIVPESNEVLWFSERDGWGHLYLYDSRTGKLKNQITQGPWVVRDIVNVCASERRLLLLAGGIDPATDPARRTLCGVDFDGGHFEVLIRGDGDVYVAPLEPTGLDSSRPAQPAYASPGISPDTTYAVVRITSPVRGNETRLVTLGTGQSYVIASAKPDPTDVRAEPFTALAADGVTRLHGVLFFPSDFSATQRFPLIDYVYPGPQVAHQPQSYCAPNAAPAISMAELGAVTLMLDSRGIPTRSRAFHQCGYGELLEPQLADHASVVRQLCDRHEFLDPNRVAIVGYSAGGAASARALFDYSDIFRVGVSVCGSHDANLLSAFMSDKYRGPGEPSLWARQANGFSAEKLSGALLLVSGDMDPNVHVNSTITLADALVRANKSFELMMVPNEGHEILLTHGYVIRRVWDFLASRLELGTPPHDYPLSFTAHELARYERNAWREQRQQ